VTVEIRQARPEDEAALREIDAATWSADVSPAPPPPAGKAFFDGRIRPADVLVAEIASAVVASAEIASAEIASAEIASAVAGYAALGPATALASNAHVMVVRSVAVDPARQRRGAGRRLMEASVAEARARGARKLVLRVLGVNVRARQLYESCGFQVEGILREEFFLDGRYVDDVLMARTLIAG
jgi:ribosomal protein S18 acetylase RimI-like enzyme